MSGSGNIALLPSKKKLNKYSNISLGSVICVFLQNMLFTHLKRILYPTYNTSIGKHSKITLRISYIVAFIEYN